MLVACAHWLVLVPEHSELGVRGAGRGLVGSMVQPGCQGCVCGGPGGCVSVGREGGACRGPSLTAPRAGLAPAEG